MERSIFKPGKKTSVDKFSSAGVKNFMSEKINKYATSGMEKWTTKKTIFKKFSPQTHPTDFEKAAINKYAVVIPKPYVKEGGKSEIESPIEEITNVIVNSTTTETEKIEETIINGVKTQRTKQSDIKLMQRVIDLLKVNMRPALYLIASATTLAIIIALFQVYFAAGSWLMFLTILKNLGIKVIPAIFLKTLKNTGISLGSNVSINFLLGMAEKNKTIEELLSKRMEPKIIVNALNKFGIKVDAGGIDLSVKNLTRQAISNGIMIASGDIYTFLISTSISKSIDVSKSVGVGVKKKFSDTISILVTAKNKVVDKILTDTLAPTDTIEITREIENDLRLPLEAPKTEPGTQKTISSSTKEMLMENKAMIMGTTAAISLVTIALTNDSSAITELLSTQISSITETATNVVPDLTQKGFDFIKENTLARQALFSLLANKIGLNKIIDLLGDRLTPDQITKWKKFDPKKSTPGPGSVTEFFGMLMGEKIYTQKELNVMDLIKLKNVAKIKNIKFSSDVQKITLVKLIENDQKYRLQNITQIVSGTIGSTIRATLATATLETIYQTSPNLDEIKKLLLEVQPISGPFQEELDLTKTTIDSEQEWKKKMDETQKLLVEEKARLRARLKEERPKVEKPIREDPKITATRRDAARRLRAAAMAEDIARKINIVITDEKGVAHPIPIDDLLLDPRLQKAMEGIEFTPLMQYLTLQAAKSTTSWIPGIGWVGSSINTANWVLDITEKIKDVYKVTNVALEIVSEAGQSVIDIGEKGIETLDWLLKKRIPSLGQAVEDLVQLEKENLKKITLEALRDKIIYGWNDNQVAYEIGKKILLGKKGGDIAENVVIQVGDLIRKSIKF